MGTLKLKSGSTPARKSPARSTKPAAKRTPARKPAAKAKPAPVQAQAEANGSGRAPRLPEGWTKADLSRAMKGMNRLRKDKENAAAKLAETQEAVNQMALDLISEGLQMSVVVDKEEGLAISRQWLYNLMENLYNKYSYEAPVQTERQASAKKPTRGRSASASRTSKPAAKKRPAAKASAKPKPAAKRTAPARKAPARKPPTPAVTGRGRVRIK